MKILIVSSIYPDAIETLRQDHDVVCAFNAKEDEFKAAIVDREVVILRSGVQLTAAVMACAPDLKLILRAGSGFDNIDVNYVNEKGLHLVRIPEPGAKAVAEMSFTFMLALARNLFEADRLTRQGRWAKNQLTGKLLTGKRLASWAPATSVRASERWAWPGAWKRSAVSSPPPRKKKHGWRRKASA